jgi:hypothetical protein
MKKIPALFIALLFICVARSQNVGIGTATPGAKLEVAGGVKVSDSINIGGRVRITSGSPQVGKVLTCDANGVGTWATPAVPGAHYIGEIYGGGIVFFIYDNGLHGLIAATVDQSAGITWVNGVYKVTGATGDGLGAGARNTAIIIASQMGDNQAGNFAAKICADYQVTVDGVTYGDWYLPSKYELNILAYQSNWNGGVVGNFSDAWYSSSTESATNYVWVEYMTSLQQGQAGKGASDRVRAIRAF